MCKKPHLRRLAVIGCIASTASRFPRQTTEYASASVLENVHQRFYQTCSRTRLTYCNAAVGFTSATQNNSFLLYLLTTDHCIWCGMLSNRGNAKITGVFNPKIVRTQWTSPKRSNRVLDTYLVPRSCISGLEQQTWAKAVLLVLVEYFASDRNAPVLNQPAVVVSVSLRKWTVQGRVRMGLKLIALWSQRMKIVDSAIHELTSLSSSSFPVDLIVSNSRSSTVQVSTGTVMRKRQIGIFACA